MLLHRLASTIIPPSWKQLTLLPGPLSERRSRGMKKNKPQNGFCPSGLAWRAGAMAFATTGRWWVRLMLLQGWLPLQEQQPFSPTLSHLLCLYEDELGCVWRMSCIANTTVKTPQNSTSDHSAYIPSIQISQKDKEIKIWLSWVIWCAIKSPPEMP